jgi:hypothetical protein
VKNKVKNMNTISLKNAKMKTKLTKIHDVAAPAWFWIWNIDI